MTEQDRNVVDAMLKFGGSFVKHLAEACNHADSDNLAKIKATWPEYWKQYTEFAAMGSK